jgi:hypothetical protein
MDRGVKEREVVKNLPAIVKQTLSLQRVRLSQQSSSASRVTSDESATQSSLRRASSWDASSGTDIQDTDFVLLQSSTSPGYKASDAGPNVVTFDSRDANEAEGSPRHATPAAAAIGVSQRKETIDMILTNDSWSVPPVQFEEDQASLLMHFFDHVVPRLFRFYNPSVLEGGRGWLLSILIRTKPLYQFICVSPTINIDPRKWNILRSEPCKTAGTTYRMLTELRRHLERFRIGTQVKRWEENIEIMACIALLIALELTLARPILRSYH